MATTFTAFKARRRLDDTREHFLKDRHVQIQFLSRDQLSHPPKTVIISDNTTYGDVATVLNQGSSTWPKSFTRPRWTLLQTVYGPKPYWIESDGISILEDTCQTLYAVENGLPYALGLVRKPDSDYPLAIFDNRSLGKTISAAFIAMDPSLKYDVGSITHYFTTGDVSNIPWNLSLVKPYNEHAHHFPTAFIITTNQPPEALNLDIPPKHPILPFLQNPFIDGRELLRQSYNLEFFPLQMIHLSTSLLHAITSLATTLARLEPNLDKLVSPASLRILPPRIPPITQHTLFSRDPREDTVTENYYPAQILEVAPLLAHNLEKLMDGLRSILESNDFDRRHQDILDQTFLELCGDYPGAVAIRRSQSTLEALKFRDQEKNERILAERGLLNRFLREARRLFPWP